MKTQGEEKEFQINWKDGTTTAMINGKVVTFKTIQKTENDRIRI